MRSITEEQFASLEGVHGRGMVVPISVGEDDYVFRRPNDLDIEILLEAKGRGEHGYLEECAASCLLSPDAPRAGVSIDQNKLLPQVEQDLLIEEKTRLRALWKSAPAMRDVVSMAWAEMCGWVLTYDAKPLGGGRYQIAARPNKYASMDKEIAVDLTARVFAPLEYSEFRKLNQTQPEGYAERYAWRTLVEVTAADGRSRDEVARVYPFMVQGMGQFLPALGTEGRAVRPKKFGGGQTPPPGPTTSKPSAGT